MANSRVPAVLDRLVVVATTAVAATPTKVFRGPVVTGDPGNAIHIGYDGMPMGDYRSVNVTSTWAGLGARARNEEFVVYCAVTVLNGDTNVKAATDETYNLFNLFETALRDDPDLNQTPRLTAAINSVELFTMMHPAGLQVLLSFTIHVSARI